MSSSPAELKTEWKSVNKTWGHPFHPMCSYMAMFPPGIPHYFIEKFTKRGDAVLDPFSGRGTTATQACADGRIGIGTDLNPLAYFLTIAKVDPPTLDETLKRIANLEAQQTAQNIENEPEKIQAIFHHQTLSQLVFLKQKLDKINRTDRFIIASILGIIHGKMKAKMTDSNYLSVDMPNTFSMSPNYIKKYIAEKNLPLLPIDVFEKLRWKVDRLFRDGAPQKKGFASLCDIRDLPEQNIPAIQKKTIKLVVSSPPYLKVIKYGLYNWIRLWFLDIPQETVDKTLDDAHKIKPYLDFMEMASRQVFDVLCNSGVCVWVIGDVQQNGKENIKLAELVWKRLEQTTDFRLIQILEDPIANHKKVTKIWGKSKRGQATKIDRLLVMSKWKKPKISVNSVAW
ncbi:site-specific DNA-methyltransferase [bacterium]|nr:site-specific DNA-methyltransferase [bacterium]